MQHRLMHHGGVSITSVWLGIFSKFLNAYAHDNIHIHACVHIVCLTFFFPLYIHHWHPSGSSLFFVLPSASWALTSKAPLSYEGTQSYRGHFPSSGLFTKFSFLLGCFTEKILFFWLLSSLLALKTLSLLYARLLVVAEMMAVGQSDWKDKWGTDKVSIAYRSSLLPSTNYPIAQSSNSKTMATVAVMLWHPTSV